MPGVGIEPTLTAYETALDTNLLPSKFCVGGRICTYDLQVMSLECYYYTTPTISIIIKN